METLQELTWFYQKTVQDPTIAATHISLYMALFQHWNLNRFQNPVFFTSREVMPLAKIGSRATYHNCLTVLVQRGYLRYYPSCNPLLKSYVQLL